MPHHFDGFEADNGYIKAHVLPGFAYLYHDERTAVYDAGGPFNGLIRAFHGFDGHAGAVTDHYGLSQIESRNLARDFPAVGNILRFVRVRRAVRQDARSGNQRFQE